MRMPGYLIGGDTGETAESLARKRALAEAMIARGSQGGSSIPEAAEALGQAIGGRFRMAGINKAQKAGETAFNQQFGSILGGMGGPAPSGPMTAAPQPGPQAMVKALGGGKDTGTGAMLAKALQKDFGLTPGAAAGFAGNLAHESGNFKTLQEINPTVKGSRGGFGWAQWTGPRRRAFEAYAKTNGLDPSSPEANYGFLKHELTSTPESAVLSKLQGVDDPARAAQIVSKNYLRPGVPHMDSRINYAGQIAGQLGGGGISTGTPVQPPMPQPRPQMAAGLPTPTPGAAGPVIQPPAFSQSAAVSPPVASPPGPTATPQISGVAPTGPQSAPPPQMALPQQPVIEPAGAPPTPQQAAPEPLTNFEKQAIRLMEEKGMTYPPAFTERLKAKVQALQGSQGDRGGPRAPQAPMGQGEPPMAPQGAPEPAGAAPQAAGQPGMSPSLQQLYQIASNGYAQPWQRELAGKLIEQQMAQQDPGNQLDLEYKRAQIAKMQQGQSPEPYTLNPGDIRFGPDNKPIAQGGPRETGGNLPARVQEYNLAVEDLKARGVPPEKIPSMIEFFNPKSAGISFTSPDGTQIQIGGTGGQGGNLPAEMGARIGLGERFSQVDAPEIRKAIQSGGATGPIDYLSGRLGRGQAGEVHRRMATGVDALVRNLTGAGKSESEVRDYTQRYLPAVTDDADTLERKLTGLEADLAAVAQGAVRGKSGTLNTLLKGQEGWGSTVDQSMKDNATKPVQAAPAAIVPDLRQTPDDTSQNQPGIGSEGDYAQPAPKPGEVIQGYRFKGGDPSDKANWEPVR
jgi:hypothetical protein